MIPAGLLRRIPSPLVVAICGLVTMALAAWAAGGAAERAALAALDRQARSTLAIQAAALRVEIERQSALPLTLASDPEIARLLEDEAGTELPGRVSARLATIAAATGAAAIYSIRPDGLTIATSNAGAPDSFLGQNFAFRPYFRRALAEGSGSQFALGTTSGRPGLYLARRVGRQAGVVVAKVEFDAVESGWRAGGDRVFATDGRGIILVSSDPSGSSERSGRSHRRSNRRCCRHSNLAIIRSSPSRGSRPPGGSCASAAARSRPNLPCCDRCGSARSAGPFTA